MRILLPLLAFPLVSSAGVHVSNVEQNPLPAEWPGFLRDWRAMRFDGTPASPLTERDTEAVAKLEALAKQRPLTPDETADLGGLYLRLNKTDKALAVLRPMARDHADHYRLASNLGTAWFRQGEFGAAADALADAAKLAPERWKKAEEVQLKLVRSRAKDKNADNLDDLFGAKPPADAIGLAQQLCIWQPNDPRLLWQLAELVHADGDVTLAASLMDGAVTDFALKSETARARRTLFRAAADELAKQEDHQRHRGSVKFASSRVFPKLLDESKLPKIDPKGTNPLPWLALAETSIGRKFQPKFLDYVAKLDGLTVRSLGFARPGGNGGETAEFLLTEFAVGCWFCESPGPTQVLWIELAEGGSIEFSTTPMEIVGTLKLNTIDPEAPLMRIVNAVAKKAQ